MTKLNCYAPDCTRAGAQNGKLPFCIYHVHCLRSLTVSVGTSTFRVTKLLDAMRPSTKIFRDLMNEALKYLITHPLAPEETPDNDPDKWMVDDPE